MWRNDPLYNAHCDGNYVSWTLQQQHKLEPGFVFPVSFLKKKCSHTVGMVKTERVNTIMSQCVVRDQTLLTLLGELPALFTMNVPRAVSIDLLRALEKGGDGPHVLVTPKAYTSTLYSCFEVEAAASSHDVVLRSPPERIGGLPLQKLETWKTKHAWFNRGSGWRKAAAYDSWGPAFHLNVVRLCYFISDLKNLKVTCVAAARLTCPEKDVESLALPTAPMVYRYTVKLDLLCMLWQRARLKELRSQGVRYSRNLIVDCSPQAHWDFLIVIEELFIRVSEPVFNPLGGFQWIRRRLPLSCNGKGAGTASAKVNKIANSAILECGIDELGEWRGVTKNWLTDQCGTDRKLNSCPFAANDTASVMQALERGELQLGDEPVANAVFLPNAIDSPDMLHVLWNAGEEAIKRTEEWTVLEPLIKVVVKNVGESSYKERLLATSLKNAPNSARRRIQSFSYSVVDWKWEHMHYLLSSLCGIWPDFQRYYNFSDFEDGSHRKTVLEALALPWFGIGIECISLFLSGVCVEAGTMEGCYCHPDVHADTYAKRRRLLEDADVPGGKCAWRGRHSCRFALGEAGRIKSRMSSLSSVRWQEILVTSEEQASVRFTRVLSGMITFFNSTVCDGKMKVWEHIPHNVTGAFGQYLGFDRAEAKACLQRGFHEYRAVVDKSSLTQVAHNYYGLESVVSLQLYEFCTTDGTDLHDYKEAFLAVQEQALGAMTGRVVEAEHKQVKAAITRGFKHSKPAVACARSRCGQSLDVVDSVAGADFVCQKWNSLFFSELLGHRADKHQLAKMSWACKLSKVYQYSEIDLFPDTSEVDRQMVALEKERARHVAKPSVPITPQAHYVVVSDMSKSSHVKISAKCIEEVSPVVIAHAHAHAHAHGHTHAHAHAHAQTPLDVAQSVVRMQ